MATRTVLVVLCLALAVLGDNYPQKKTATNIFGTAGNGTIWYQTANFINFGNILNPVTVSIVYNINSANYPASVCLNSYEGYFGITGADLARSCPSNAIGTTTNVVSQNFTQLEDTSMYATRFSSSKTQFLNNRLSRLSIGGDSTPTYSTENTTASLYVKPSPNQLIGSAGFIVTIPDSENLEEFSLSVEWYECSESTEYPVGPAQACVTIPELQIGTTQQVQVLAGGWAYFQYSAGVFDSSVLNSFSVSINATASSNSVQFVVQEGYLPTIDWYINGEIEEDDDDGYTTLTILTPGNIYIDETFFFGIYNGGDSSVLIEVNSTSSPCSSSSNFGYDCSASSITSLPATIYPNSTLSGVNNGTASSYDFSDDSYDGQYAYFQITDYPQVTNIGGTYFIRVSVANNDISDTNGAPGLFAKMGSIPSEQSNTYNVSTIGDVSHQIALPVVQTANGTVIPTNQTWFIAVKLPADFSIWVGENCANNCSSGKHGNCYCQNQTCVELTNNGENLVPLYNRALYLKDSAGSCTCDDLDYIQSFTCTEKNNGFIGIYMLLLAVLILFVFVVSILIPVFCFIRRKKNARHERGENNYETI